MTVPAIYLRFRHDQINNIQDHLIPIKFINFSQSENILTLAVKKIFENLQNSRESLRISRFFSSQIKSVKM